MAVLEARNRIGGRISDNASLGLIAGLGGQILSGCVNNPVTIMCEQARLHFDKVQSLRSYAVFEKIIFREPPY